MPKFPCKICSKCMANNKKPTCYDLCDIYIDTKCNNKTNSATYMLQNDKIK